MNENTAVIFIQRRWRERQKMGRTVDGVRIRLKLLNRATAAKTRVAGNRKNAETKALAAGWFVQQELDAIEKLFFSLGDSSEEMLAEGILDAPACVALMGRLKLPRVAEVWQVKNIFKDMNKPTGGGPKPRTEKPQVQASNVNSMAAFDDRVQDANQKTCCCCKNTRAALTRTASNAAEKAGNAAKKAKTRVAAKANSVAEKAKSALTPQEKAEGVAHINYLQFLEETFNHKSETFNQHNLATMFQILDFDGGRGQKDQASSDGELTRDEIQFFLKLIDTHIDDNTGDRMIAFAEAIADGDDPEAVSDGKLMSGEFVDLMLKFDTSPESTSPEWKAEVRYIDQAYR